MARNEEKAQSMLNRWLKYKSGLGDAGEDRRPFLSSSVDNLNECDKWRKQVVREVARKVAQIQNGGIGEHRIRELNDEINKLLREKHHWQRRLKELGGADYSRSARITDADGQVVVGNGGYMYFGAARELPGVKELLEKAKMSAESHHFEDKNKKSRAELHRMVDPAYYGLEDEPSELQRLEKMAENEAWAAEMEAQKHQFGANAVVADTNVLADIEQALADGLPQQNIHIPTKQDIEQQMLERKKRALLAKIAS